VLHRQRFGATSYPLRQAALRDAWAATPTEATERLARSVWNLDRRSGGPRPIAPPGRMRG
jgi:hypothetical protein